MNDLRNFDSNAEVTPTHDLRAFNAWTDAGYKVKKGSKRKGRINGAPAFTRDQVEPYKPKYDRADARVHQEAELGEPSIADMHSGADPSDHDFLNQESQDSLDAEYGGQNHER